MAKIPELAESVSEQKIPSTKLTIFKGKVNNHANAIKKDLDGIATVCKNIATLTNNLAKKGGLSGNYNGKPLKQQVESISKKFNSRATWCNNRAKALTNGINDAAEDMQKQLVRSSKNWNEFQEKFKQYEL